MNTYIFDFDGTIADSFSHACHVLMTHADYLGCKTLTMPELLMLKDLHAREVLKYLGIPLWRTGFFVRKLRNIINKYAEEITIFPGWEVVLKSLHKEEHQIGLISSNSSKTVELILNKYDLLSLFDFISCGKSLFGKKRILKKIIRRNNLDLSKTYYIGDEVRDMEAAHAAQIKAVAVGWGFNSMTRLKQAAPHHFIDNMEQLQLLLAEPNSFL